MTQETKNKMEAIFAAAMAKKNAGVIGPEITETDLKKIAEDAAQDPPAKMLSFSIIWSETSGKYDGQTFNTWSAAQDALAWICRQHKGLGYTKTKVNIKWEGGHEITDRVDCSKNGGDFWAPCEFIGDYLKIQNSVMYQSNLNKGTRCLLSWNDEKPAPELSKPEDEKTTPEIIEAQKPIQIVDYNEKSFAVIGEGTKAIKDKLKAIGGAWNNFLKCGPGWIFSKKHLSKVQLLIN